MASFQNVLSPQGLWAHTFISTRIDSFSYIFLIFFTSVHGWKLALALLTYPSMWMANSINDFVCYT